MFEKGEIISITYVYGESECSHTPLTETINNCIVEEFDNGLLKVKQIIKPTHVYITEGENDKLDDKEKVREYVFNIRSPIFAFARK